MKSTIACEKNLKEKITQLASETELMEKSKYSNFVEFAKELLKVKEVTEAFEQGL